MLGIAKRCRNSNLVKTQVWSHTFHPQNIWENCMSGNDWYSNILCNLASSLFMIFRNNFFAVDVVGTSGCSSSSPSWLSRKRFYINIFLRWGRIAEYHSQYFKYIGALYSIFNAKITIDSLIYLIKSIKLKNALKSDQFFSVVNNMQLMQNG